MKKYVCFTCLLICFLSFFGCDTEGDNWDVGYYEYSFSFFYPEDIEQNYTFVFEGKEGANGIVPRNTPNGLLEIHEKENGNIVFSQNISLEERQNIQFIKIGDRIDIYSEDKFIPMTPSVIFTNEADSYTIWFNDQELQNNVINYIPTENLTGDLEIRKTGETTPIFSTEVTITAGMSINLMQLSDTEFLDIPEDTEPEPTVYNTSKVRFLYTGDEILNTDEIILKLYKVDVNWDWSSQVPVTYTLTLQRGVISEYVEFNMTDINNDYYIYSIELPTGEVIIDYDSQMFISDYLYGDDTWSFLGWKKATVMISGGGNTIEVLTGLSIPWEQQ